jgi:hypothetical protein
MIAQLVADVEGGRQASGRMLLDDPRKKKARLQYHLEDRCIRL